MNRITLLLASLSVVLAITACDDKVQVDLPAEFTQPYSTFGFQNPWSLPGVLGYTSATATAVFNRISASPVPGLTNVRFGDVFQAFQQKGCYLFIKGGVVRDMFLGLSPADVDMVYSCEDSTVLDMLKQKQWTFAYCGNPVIVIGTDVPPCSADAMQNNDLEELNEEDNDGTLPLDTIDALNWNSLSGIYSRDVTLEYTTNALYYDVATNKIIDVTGLGVSDTCSHLARIPATDATKWPTWAKAHQLIRYWKLISAPKNYQPANVATKNFIVSTFKDMWNQPDSTKATSRDAFKYLYCQKHGGSYTLGDHVCNVPASKCINGNLPAKDQAIMTELIRVMKLDLEADFFDGYVAPWTVVQCQGAANANGASGVANGAAGFREARRMDRHRKHRRHHRMRGLVQA